MIRSRNSKTVSKINYKHILVQFDSFDSHFLLENYKNMLKAPSFLLNPNLENWKINN